MSWPMNSIRTLEPGNWRCEDAEKLLKLIQMLHLARIRPRDIGPGDPPLSAEEQQHQYPVAKRILGSDLFREVQGAMGLLQCVLHYGFEDSENRFLLFELGSEPLYLPVPWLAINGNEPKRDSMTDLLRSYREGRERHQEFLTVFRTQHALYPEERTEFMILASDAELSFFTLCWVICQAIGDARGRGISIADWLAGSASLESIYGDHHDASSPAEWHSARFVDAMSVLGLLKTNDPTSPTQRFKNLCRWIEEGRLAAHPAYTNLDVQVDPSGASSPAREVLDPLHIATLLQAEMPQSTLLALTAYVGGTLDQTFRQSQIMNARTLENYLRDRNKLRVNISGEYPLRRDEDLLRSYFAIPLRLGTGSGPGSRPSIEASEDIGVFALGTLVNAERLDDPGVSERIQALRTLLLCLAGFASAETIKQLAEWARLSNVSDLAHELKHVGIALTNKWLLTPEEAEQIRVRNPELLQGHKVAPRPAIIVATGRLIQLWSFSQSPEGLFDNHEPQSFDDLVSVAWGLTKDTFKPLVCKGEDVRLAEDLAQIDAYLLSIDALWNGQPNPTIWKPGVPTRAAGSFKVSTTGDPLPKPFWTMSDSKSLNWFHLMRFFVSCFMEAIRHASCEKDINVSLSGDDDLLTIIVSNDCRLESEHSSLASWFVRATDRVATELAPATAKGSIVRTRIARALGGDFVESPEMTNPHAKTLTFNMSALHRSSSAQ